MIPINLQSEVGRLNAVLLHRPGNEIEAMTPTNAKEALYSDILNLDIVSNEYSMFSGTLEKVAKQVYYVEDLLAQVLTDDDICERIVLDSCKIDGCECLVDELLQHSPQTLAHELIEGVRYREGKDPQQYAQNRYLLKPLYNLFFTRDASSCLYDRVLVNSMTSKVRARESLLYKYIFEQEFKSDTLWAALQDSRACTEGGDIHVVREGLLCIGNGIRTNQYGIDYLVNTLKQRDDTFCFIVQELPHTPESFIHLDMVFTFLGPHRCMVYKPMIDHRGIFANMRTYLIRTTPKQVVREECPNILSALQSVGMEMEPVFCGGDDEWIMEREQWHSGTNFFSFGENHIIGYRRNTHTIDALNKAGFDVLKAEDVVSGKVDPWSYRQCVVTFAASELPRGGGGARCMTCPVNREPVNWNL